MRHFVVGTTELETEHGEKILSLQEHTALQAIADVDRMVKRGFLDNVVDTGRQDQPEILYTSITSVIG